MKKFLLAPLAVATLAVFSTPSFAIYNLYKADGLSFDVNGEINLYGESEHKKAIGQDSAVVDFSENLSDERIRLYPEQGASWIDFRGSQDIGNDWRVTGTLGMGYAAGNTGTYLNSANLSFDKLNQGAISFGRQYLHTGYVGRTNTYNPLDVFGAQAIRLDYYGVPNLHTSAYYLLPSSTDVRKENSNAETEGFGASASYTIPFNDNQSLRLAAGYTDSRYKPSSGDPLNKKAYAASAEYRFGKALLAADFGNMNADMTGSVLAESDSDYYGVKVGYEIHPKFTMVAGYGTREAKATYKDGVTAARVRERVLKSVNNAGISEHLAYSLMYDKLTQKQTYVRGDYYLRDNVRLYGQVQKEQTQAELSGADFAKVDDLTYRLGVSLSF